MKNLKYLFVVLAVVALALTAGSAFAAIQQLTDLNSVVQFDDQASASGSTRQMFNWTVDGIAQLWEQDWWVRVGPAGNQIELTDNTVFTQSPWTIGPSTAEVTFAGLGLSVTAKYTLTGGSVGSKTSDMAETLRVVNTLATAQSVSVFQYCDFDLGGSISDLGVQFVNANVVKQWDEAWQVGETVLATGAAPTRHEANLYANTLNSLLGPAYNLNNANSAGPGDVTWAWQWDHSLLAGGTLLISKDKQISPVPEIPAAALAPLGLAALGLLKRKFA